MGDEFNIKTVTPNSLRVEDIGSGNTLLIGAPYIGKTHFVRTAADCGIETTTDLATAVDMGASGRIVIDDFYTAYQSATQDERDRFRTALDHEDGIWVTVRPRALDWLIERNDGPLTGKVLDAFDYVYLLGYAADSPDERKDAINHCLTLTEEEGRKRLDKKAVRSNLDYLRYPSYNFDNDRLADELDEYSATIVPSLVLLLSSRLPEGSGTIFADGVVNACFDFARNFSLNEAIDNVKAAGQTILASGGIQATGTTLVGSAPFVGAGAILLWGLLREDKLPVSEVYDRLLDEELTPVTKATIEDRLDLAPYTIDNLQVLAKEGNVERLRHLLAAAGKLDDVPVGGGELDVDVEGLNDAVADIRDNMSDHRELLAEFETTVDRLNEQVVAYEEVAEFVADHIAEATDGLNAMELDIRTDEQRFLDVESVDIERILDSYQGDEPEKIVDFAGDNNLILLVGPHGTGKTTAGYKACKRLTELGYTVRLPQFEQAGIGFVEKAMKKSLSASNDTVAFTSFRAGIAPFREGHELKRLLEWVDEGICSTVIVEVRDERYRNLRTEVDDVLSQAQTASAVWRDRKKVEFNRNPNLVPNVVKWSLDVLRWEGDTNKIIELVSDFAEGNPEVAKIATRYAIDPEQYLAEIDSTPELVWDDIKNIANDSECGNLFERLSAVRSMTTAEITAVTRHEGSDLRECGEELIGYLGGDLREEYEKNNIVPIPDSEDKWTVAPELYAEVVFRYQGIERGEWINYFADFDTANQNHLYPRLAGSMADAYHSAKESSDEQYIDEVIDAGERFIFEVIDSESDREIVRLCTYTLLRAGMPIEEELIGKIAENARGDDGHSRPAPDDTKLLIDKYSEALVNLAERYQDPNTVESSINEISSKISRAASSDAHPYPCSTFLEKVYSSAISELAKIHPDPQHTQALTWLDLFETKAIQTANAKTHGTPTSTFLTNLYSNIIVDLVEGNPDPSAIAHWLDEIQHRALVTAERDSQEVSLTEFLKDVYSMAVVKLVERNPEPESLEDWLDEIKHRTEFTSHSDLIDEHPDEFRSWTTAMSVERVFDRE